VALTTDMDITATTGIITADVTIAKPTAVQRIATVNVAS
jgi:hypothetical protein